MTPDELRSAIAANPQDAAERGRLINAAIENNMVDEIPPDWSFQIGVPPEDAYRAGAQQGERDVYADWEWHTDPSLGFVMYDDGTVAIVDMSGGEYGDTIVDINPDRAWTIETMNSLEENFNWAIEVTENFGDLLNWMGERQVDPSNGLFAWRTTMTGPANSGQPDLIVGVNASGQVTMMFPEQSPLRAVTFDVATGGSVDKALISFEQIRDDLEGDEE